GSRLRPEGRQAPAADAEGSRPRLAEQGALGKEGVVTPKIRRARPSDASAIVRMANALNRHEALSPRAFTAAIVCRDAFGARRAIRFYRALGAHVGHARIVSLRGRALAIVAAGR